MNKFTKDIEVQLYTLLYKRSKIFKEFCDANSINLNSLIKNIKNNLPLFYPKLQLNEEDTISKIKRVDGEIIDEAITDSNDDVTFDYETYIVSIKKNAPNYIYIIPIIGANMRLILKILKQKLKDKNFNIRKITDLEMNSVEIRLNNKLDIVNKLAGIEHMLNVYVHGPLKK